MIELSKLLLGGVALAATLDCAASGSPPKPMGRAETVSIESPTGSSRVTLRHDPSGANVTVAVPVGRAWAALVAAYAALPIPIQVLDSAHYYVRGSAPAYRQFLRSPVSRFVDCGSTLVGPSADSYHLQIRVESQVESATSATSNLHTRIEASGTGSGATARCTSTGSLEKLVNDQVKALLESPQ